MAVYTVFFRITDKGGDEAGIAGPKSFRPNLTLAEAERLRERLLRLETAGLVEDVDLEPEPFRGEDEQIHQLLDVFDPVAIAAAMKYGV
jgi:hypothetical protein